MMDADCILCAPPEHLLVYRTSLAQVMHFPKAVKRGHMIVGIRSHVRRLEDVPLEQLLAATSMLQKVAGAAKRVLDCERFYVAVVGDRDLHFHYHLLPKLATDAELGPFLFGLQGWRELVGSGEVSPPDPMVTAEIVTVLSER